MAIVSLMELAILILGGFVTLVRREYRVTEAAAFAILLAMLTLSCFFQVSFLVGWPSLSFFLEGIAVGLSAWMIVAHRLTLYRVWKTFEWFAGRNPAITSIFAFSWLYLAGLALLIPPSNGDSLRYHLPRVFLFQQENTLFLDVTTSSQAHRAVLPVGGDILTHLLLRFHTDYGVAIFGFLSYLAIGFGAYALSRRFVSVPVATLSTLVIASLTELVYQATSTKNDIFIAAAALCCILAVCRLSERPSGEDLLLLILFVTYGVSVKTLFLGFAMPFTAFFGALLIYRHGLRPWWQLLSRHKSRLLLLFLPVAVFSQSWLFIRNHQEFGNVSGPTEFVEGVMNQHGLLGGAANLTRHLFESADFLKVPDLVLQEISGHSAPRILQRIYDTIFYPIWGNAGTGRPFIIKWSINESKSWFGPLGFLLVLPSLAYALWRGPWFLRALVLTLFSYAWLVGWQLEWTIWRGRYFSLFFAGSVPCVAFLLERWRERAWTHRVIRIMAIFLLFYACVFNEQKLVFPLTPRAGELWDGFLHENIWVRTNWGRDRDYFYGDKAGLEDFAARVGRGASVGVAPRSNAQIYHYLRRRPDIKFFFLPPEIAADGVVTAKERGEVDWLLCIGLAECDSLEVEHSEPVKICHEVDRRFHDFCLFRLRPYPQGAQSYLETHRAAGHSDAVLDANEGSQ